MLKHTASSTGVRTSRRQFLQSSAAALLGAPFVTSGLRAASPNGKIRHAAFGASGMSYNDIKSLSGHPNWELAAVCDVDVSKMERVKKEFPEARFYQDWREMLEKEDGKIDSVNVSVPDHMHAPMILPCIAKGLHVYGQKPLAQTLHECRLVTTKAHEKGVVTQMGIQISSEFSERLAVQMIQDGVVGKVKEVHTFSHKTWGDMGPAPTKTDPVPDGFNWDLWLGVAADRPYVEGLYHPKAWRKRRDFGTGTLGDMGCHMFSGWYRALNLTMPTSVTSTGTPPPHAANWAVDGKVEYLYPGTEHTAESTVKVTWYDGNKLPPESVQKAIEVAWPKQGTVYIGTDGVLLSPHGSTPTLHPREKFKTYRYPRLEPRNHWKEFVDCCLAGGAKKPSANFDYSGPLTEAVLLGCLASIFPNQTLEWDAATQTVKNSPEATALVKRQYRPGWELAGV